MKNQPSFYSADSLTAPSCHGQSFHVPLQCRAISIAIFRGAFFIGGFESVLGPIVWSRLTGTWYWRRVPGNCAGSSNNLVPRGIKLSAIDVTAKAFFERLYLVLGVSPFEPESTVLTHPHPHCSLNSYFSISVQFFSQLAPHFLAAHDSPSNLT